LGTTFSCVAVMERSGKIEVMANNYEISSMAVSSSALTTMKSIGRHTTTIESCCHSSTNQFAIVTRYS
ncbi:hypothetical protein PFISCL1PPCAC_23523, partial [Pristionchus fissidentatus]